MTAACVLKGVAGWVPERRVTNDELPKAWLTTDSWIRSRTGVSSRHRAGPGTATSDLAFEAARRVLAGDRRVDTLILATSTPDHPLPATAPALAARLGLGPVAAFDVAAVCSGFIYALATAAGLVAAGVSERLLLVAADVYSTLLDPEDRSAGVVFGDGAGAVLLHRGVAGEHGALLGFDLGTDGTQADLITVPAGGSRHRSTGQPAAGGDHYFRMRGPEVYKHAVVRMSDSVNALLDRLGWQVQDIDRFVGHQANARILSSVCERIALPKHKNVGNLAVVGNTGAASIPLALAHADRDGVLQAGERIVLAGFGGGLTWGSAALIWPDLPQSPAPHP
ncbi:beta-ketoacyl-ACP synthase III [Streptomyces sp. NPDC048191]|uniref:beta-ketoacyl-ACP synthase III n=1 Tax=Streptomyces sp. NPDC048191 TaxID=3155484 RepID=UPI00340A754A